MNPPVRCAGVILRKYHIAAKTIIFWQQCFNMGGRGTGYPKSLSRTGIGEASKSAARIRIGAGI